MDLEQIQLIASTIIYLNYLLIKLFNRIFKNGSAKLGKGISKLVNLTNILLDLRLIYKN